MKQGSFYSLIIQFCSSYSIAFRNVPHLPSLGSCCDFARTGSRLLPASGPSPVWTGPPFQGSCTYSPDAAQGAQRTYISGRNPTTFFSKNAGDSTLFSEPQTARKKWRVQQFSFHMQSRSKSFSSSTSSVY